MIYILGSGFVAKKYAKYFAINSIRYKIISRRDVQYTDPLQLGNFLTANKPDLLINAAGFTGKPNVDACEQHKIACLYSNAILPGFIGEICQSLNIPWIHVSSGCIYDGMKRTRVQNIRPVDCMLNPLYREIHDSQLRTIKDKPSIVNEFIFEGYNELDLPNFTFREMSSFYSGSKAMGEELLKKFDNVYICRLRIPFDNQNTPRNYLNKLSTYDKLISVSNSITNIDEFVVSTYNLHTKQAPFGIYNVTNPGIADSYNIVQLLLKARIRTTEPEWITMADFNSIVKTPRSNCLLDSTKIQNVSPLTEVNESIEKAINNWIP